ncbi:anhydro-N-acetylmuramic acid kinase [Delftia tsuruhatensis]|uniref:anhydro-N-acetylmuramic acid kinase n=1 Tax=Delftia tsuruhatensis TaxID=180282 RepID=UPI0024449ACA|nr:anhydro-N-acetylmuramic acid kinase [Delftia tsuruhatensis]MDH0775063.1 anhydro-N-acetylmuramic acid kinase [Delftia tsuruhatensis]MDH1459025.1 anhydro-N-acetylmuramic acid kinase [Delftia tsuruhatensis]MDH1824485.1 anhydro-N-acetylmuramic acid kinase [Delftia tsuruhatensis]WGG11725.1 anhydro-N-acetylmuramic acid kinase [Delftia tsuruhatensis]
MNQPAPSPIAHRYCIGLMSGTSLDGVDGVLVDFAEGTQVLWHASRGFDAALRAELLALNTPEGRDELHRAALAANALARSYAEVVRELLQATGLAPAQIAAIGAHGQTVRHRPQMFDGTGYTLQLNSPALLAELSGVAVVADLRSRDVAAGGQGAPLVPAFHQGVFGRPGETVLVLNIGGIANLSVLAGDGTVLGFDCGPGNALMDGWCQTHTGQPYDDGGQWAATGQVLPALLDRLLAEPFLQQPPPKSTGRDLFHADWLAGHLSASATSAADARPAEVQATLTEFTARACASAVQRFGRGGGELLVCGGGAFNTQLMQRIAALLPGVAVDTTAARGLPPQQVEAAAFAWLARQALLGLPGNLPAVTGARGPRILGAIHPA